MGTIDAVTALRITTLERKNASTLKALEAVVEALDDIYRNAPYGTVTLAPIEEIRDAINEIRTA